MKTYQIKNMRILRHYSKDTLVEYIGRMLEGWPFSINWNMLRLIEKGLTLKRIMQIQRDGAKIRVFLDRRKAISSEGGFLTFIGYGSRASTRKKLHSAWNRYVRLTKLNLRLENNIKSLDILINAAGNPPAEKKE